MKRKKRTTVTVGGTPSHMVVWSLKRALRVTANANTRMASDRRTRNQKKIL